MVDALPSGGSVRKDVLVRIQSWALSSVTDYLNFALMIVSYCFNKLGIVRFFRVREALVHLCYQANSNRQLGGITDLLLINRP